MAVKIEEFQPLAVNRVKRVVDCKEGAKLTYDRLRFSFGGYFDPVRTLDQAPFQDRRYPAWQAFEREREEDSGRMFM